MRTTVQFKKLAAALLCLALVFVFCAGTFSVKAYADNGNVYTCVVNRCYRHPVTGIIEDSGGEASYATGQGMVEGCVYPTGILEVTAAGQYYLTIRMSLMDYTSEHTFWVQNVGDDGWMSPAAGITAYGTDTNGTTADICIEVPSESCVLRGMMYVEPMGRYVVWYMYPSDYVYGNNTDMNPAFVYPDVSQYVTENNGTSTGTGASSTGGTSGGSVSAGNSALPSLNTGGNATTATPTPAPTPTPENTPAQEAADPQSSGIPSAEGAPELQSKLTDPVSENADPSTDAALSTAQGLSLSTAQSAAGGQTSTTAERSVGGQILVNVLSILIAGCILMAIAAGLVYYFRVNWYRWGGGADDDE